MQSSLLGHMVSDSQLDSSEYYPMELRYVKALFVQAQYLQCIRACRDLLAQVRGEADKHPLQDTFVLFYTALSHDELARNLHPSSVEKTPTLESAQQFYGEALASLPSTDGAQAIYMIAQLSRDYRSPTPSKQARDVDQTPRTYQPTSMRSVSDYDQAAKSAQTWYRNDSPMDRCDSPEALGQKNTDHNSSEHDHRHNQILSHSRRLQRDYSRMSLLETPPRPKNQPTRNTVQFDSSLGNDARRQFLPKLSLSINRYGTDSAMSNRWSEYASPMSEWDEPYEPVSPLGPYDLVHEDSPISPVSPSTPTMDEAPFSPALTHDDYDEEFHDAEERFAQPAALFQERVDEMRDQIVRHMSRAQQEKAQIVESKTTNKHRSAALSRVSGYLPSSETQGDVESTEDTERSRKPAYSSPTNLPKNERIRAGRLRNWQRQRFQPERYQELCEQAIAEL